MFVVHIQSLMNRKQYTLGRKLSQEILTDSANEGHSSNSDEANNKIGSMTSKWYEQPKKEPLPNLAPFEKSTHLVDKRLLKYYKLTNYRRLKNWGVYNSNDSIMKSESDSTPEDPKAIKITTLPSKIFRE